ncbi:hypothetical protein [Jidongwangia harbinensis]|uniref:hypothetical protein n=1 Tax=Jidongwangia harbinensis TaxID=2878561 RepID=UPI001CD9640A|nr:hypothetical protein [Jidongwangia harbinensis]MCA2216901.1 hypothetical protein [Jidongwangia harbinensis]
MGSDPHSNPDSGYHEISSHTRRKTTRRGQSAITDITIGHIETVTMTDTEYADAVETLAVLIARYERHHHEQPGTAA